MKMKMGKLWNNINREKPKHLERKISQFQFFSPQMSHGLKMDRTPASAGPVINLLSHRKTSKSDIDFNNMWKARSYLAQDIWRLATKPHRLRKLCRFILWTVWTYRYRVWRKVRDSKCYKWWKSICRCILNIERHCLLHCTEDHRCKNECLCNYLNK